MMLKLNVEILKETIENCDDFLTAGRLDSVQGTIRAKVSAGVGELCKILPLDGPPILCEVIGFDRSCALLMPLVPYQSLAPGAEVVALGRRMRVPVGPELLGRVLNASGNPIDDLGETFVRDYRKININSPDALRRPKIRKPFYTGQRAIDGLLTLGCGQRIGLFAGSGVGKSSLVGEIAKHSSADINIVVLVGERGREVRPFVEDCLGPQGLAKSIVIVATAEQPPLVRIRAAETAITMADWFRDQGNQVLFIVDSLTRLAIAQRELGLMLGEPPTARGFPPSALQLIANLMEPLGNTDKGSITGILSVLVDGDDTNEPVADTVRGVLDGHIVMDRKLAEKNHFPAINVSRSLSRVFPDVVDADHLDNAKKIRNILATYEEVEDIVRIGMYQTGTSEQIDQAIHLKQAIDFFAQQSLGEVSTFGDTRKMMQQIAAAWSHN